MLVWYKSQSDGGVPACSRDNLCAAQNPLIKHLQDH